MVQPELGFGLYVAKLSIPLIAAELHDRNAGWRHCLLCGDALRVAVAQQQVSAAHSGAAVLPQVTTINLKGLDRVVFVTYLPDLKRVLFRQYNVKYKKSGEQGAGAGSLLDPVCGGCPGGCSCQRA